MGLSGQPPVGLAAGEARSGHGAATAPASGTAPCAPDVAGFGAEPRGQRPICRLHARGEQSCLAGAVKDRDLTTLRKVAD